MAARSPIVVDSPSPTVSVSELSPTTPKHHTRTSTVATSSSPALLSISRLVRPADTTLTSRSRAQESPPGAKAGVAGAASPSKAQKSEAGPTTAPQQDEDTTIAQNGANGTSPTRDKAGKLPRRRKPEETGTTAGEPSIAAQSAFSACAYRDATGGRRNIPAIPASASRPNAEREDPRHVLAPSILLSEYDFRPEEGAVLGAQTLPVRPVKKPRKPRKPSAKTDDMKADGVVKKPRKRNAKTDETGEDTKKRSRQAPKKSESIILNSDDLAATQADTYSRIEIPSPPPKIKKAKKTAAKSAPKPKWEGASMTFATAKVTSEKSTYFDEPARQQKNGATVEDPDDPKGPLDLTGIGSDTTPESPTLPQVAPRRRLSWTPAKKPASKTLECHETAPDTESADEEPTTKSLAQLVSGLGYASGSAYIPPTAGQRSASGEALTKRRRIDLADEATKAPARRRASPGPAPAEKPKKAKAPKKKPQTITDLATKAYRAPEEEAPAQPTVSEFFSAQKTDDVPTTEANINDSTVETKKPRKPRTKKVDGDGSKLESALKTTKSKKVKKVKIAEDSYLANLHTPHQARAQERRQEFLFGTSSQLGVEDSPTFIRDMQMAVRESEVAPESQIDGPKGRARVLNGSESSTVLSITQANKNLWCTAARDTDGDVMRLDSATIRIVRAREKLIMPKTFVTEAVAPAPAVKILDVLPDVPAETLPLPETLQDDEVFKRSAQPPQLQGKSPAAPEGSSQQEIIDLCHTSPIAEIDDAALSTLRDLPQATYLPSSEPAANGPTEPEANEPQPEEIWAIIPSDNSPRQQEDHPSSPRAIGPHLHLLQHRGAIPQLKRSATSPIPRRSALQALDANITSIHQTSPGKGLEAMQQRSPATAAGPSIIKRPRGRPKKNAIVDEANSISPKKRDRAPKADTVAAATKEAGIGISRPQSVASGSSGFACIDDISDPDCDGVATPSPPRRRAMSSPPELRTLDFDTTESPSKPKVPRTALVTLKPGDGYFVTTIQPSLFPLITNTVMSEPPSNSLSNPSWHEKILLYDPIVLEDFTAWLNEKGLTIELQRSKPKRKTKGRKKKEAPPEPDSPKYETVKEELKPWMVQKWCEEKSVCCLWKEGLRGGVRTRY